MALKLNTWILFLNIKTIKVDTSSKKYDKSSNHNNMEANFTASKNMFSEFSLNAVWYRLDLVFDLSP